MTQPISQKQRQLYPALQPYETGFLPEQDGHTVFYELAGNPDGIPVCFIHGGPGGSLQPMYRQFFDPERYNIVLFDQRGCGNSTPHASLEHNSTWHLVADMERLRTMIGAEQWMLFGGSWGSTLSLAYAQKHPQRVLAMVLRGIFLLRKRELDWFYQDGASRVFPDAYEQYVAQIPEAERGDMLAAYYKRLTSDDKTERTAAARAYCTWEAACSKLIPSPALIDAFAEDNHAIAMARIEAHYFVNGGFLDHEDQLLDDCTKMADIPGVIVQGRYDMVCAPETAWELHKRWPKADMKFVGEAGHSASEPGIISELVAATDRFADELDGVAS